MIFMAYSDFIRMKNRLFRFNNMVIPVTKGDITAVRTNGKIGADIILLLFERHSTYQNITAYFSRVAFRVLPHQLRLVIMAANQ